MIRVRPPQPPGYGSVGILRRKSGAVVDRTDQSEGGVAYAEGVVVSAGHTLILRDPLWGSLSL